jgi:uncharacterized sulfatase
LRYFFALKLLLLIIIVFVGLTGVTACEPFPPERYSSPIATDNLPNIVLVIADDIGSNDHGFAGHRHILTPNLDEIASRGVVFNHGYVVNAICRPSLASIITGLYPSEHGILVNNRRLNTKRPAFAFNDDEYARRMDSLQTIPRVLAGLGYRSLQTGKWWEEGFANGGFTDGDKVPQGIFEHVNRRSTIGRRGIQPIIDFIEEDPDKPFFIWYAPQLPHTPFNPPDHFLELYSSITPDPRVQKYWAMVSWFDSTVGEISDYLKSSDRAKNTIIIYLADNGYSIHSRSKGIDAKNTPTETGIRTPMIFHWPDQWQPATRNQLVSSIDIFPTLMDVLRVNGVSGLSGLSFSDVLYGEDRQVRNYVVGEGYFRNKVRLRDRYEVFDFPLKYRFIRSGDWKLHFYPDRPNSLFNLSSDPDEKIDLADSRPDVVAKLESELRVVFPDQEN